MICLSSKLFLNLPIVSACPSEADPAASQRELTVSIVSHGHGALVQALVRSLGERAEGRLSHVLVTHNLPEPALIAPPGGWPFRLTELYNETPQGFGANHNQAFRRCDTSFFCVLNPDLELTGAPLWAPLLDALTEPGVGCAYPRLYNPDGTPQDSEREAVTPAALLRRHLLGRQQRRVDWVSAAFWVVPTRVFRQLGGFDERYYMYCEDTDFCLRLRLAGFSLRRADSSTVVHAAGRASRKPGRHLAWHLRSLVRLWSSPVLRNYLLRLQDGEIAQTPRQ